MRRTGSVWRTPAAVLLGLAISVWLSGCGNESRPLQPGAAGLQVRLLFPDKGQHRTWGAAAVEKIHVSAWELGGAATPRVLRDSTSTVIAPGQTHFQLELRVPPAALYLLQVEADGSLGSSSGAAGLGLVYFGADSVANLAAGETRTVQIRMPQVVPAVTGQATATSLTLHWNPVERALRYGLLEIPAPPAVPFETFTRSTDTLIVFPPHAHAEASQRRAYRVRAELPESLFSAYSDSVSVSVPQPVAPARIGDLAVVPATATATELQLTWTATGNDSLVGQARTYDLRRSHVPIDTEAAFAAATPIEGVPAPQIAGQRELFTVTGLTPATDYHFSIKAGDDVPLWSPRSNSARGATLPLPPAAPVDLSASAIADTAIRLRWTDQATNEDLYRIERRAPTDPQFVLAGVLTGSFSGTVEFQDHDLTERTSYRYRVRAENAGGVSAWTNEVVQRTGVARPTNLAARAVAPDSVTLTWSFPSPDPSDGFRLERKTGPGSYAEISRPSPANRATGDGGVQPLTTYFYRLRAADGGSVSSPSDSVAVTTPDRAAVCQIDSTALDFGTAFVGSSADRPFRITNTGGSSLTGRVATTCDAYSIVVGEGAFTLGAGESWQVIVRFSPAGPGTVRCRIVAADQCDPVVCVGVGEALPACSVNREALVFGTVAVGSAVSDTFNITNVGGGVLSGTVALPDCSEFTIVSGGGDFALSAGEVRTIRVQFSPASPGSAECVIAPTGGCTGVTCSGTGEALPSCSVDPPSLDFGTVAIGTDSVRTFTITNVGGETLSGRVVTRCLYYTIASGGGAFNLGAGQQHVVSIRFAPSIEQPPGCAVDLGVAACSPVACTGLGEAHPVCSVSPASLDFGTVPLGSDSVRTFTIMNTGGGTLTGSVGAHCSDYTIDSGGGGFSLGTGQQRVVAVRFTPSVETTSVCPVSLGTAGCSPVSCTGAGEAHPVCTLNPTSLDFGTVPVSTSLDRSFTITNTGGSKLSGSVAADCPDFEVIAGGGAYSLSTGESVTVTVRFTPLSAQSLSCPVTLGSPGNSGCLDLPCHGIGLGPVCSLSATSLHFGVIEAGQRTTQTFTITNAGGGLLAGTVILTCPNFTIDAGGGAYSLGPGASRDVTVAYVPTGPGIHDCQFATGCGDISAEGTATDPNDHWWPGFSGDAPNAAVHTLALNGSDLAVGGAFNLVGTSTTAYVAWWNGSAWTTNTDFTWTQVDVLQSWQGALGQGTLVGAGIASDLPGNPVGQLVNGGWQFVGYQFYYGPITAFATWQNALLAGGSFTYPFTRLASWGGDSWVAADQGLVGGGVNDLEAFGGSLYAAAGSVLPSSGAGGAIYRLDGTSWTQLTSTIGGAFLDAAQKLTSFGGALFTVVSAEGVSYVARLQGTTLIPVGAAEGGSVTDIASDGIRLYAVGTFAGIGGVVAQRAASWDGSTWRPLGSGISGGQAYPNVVLAYNGSIYVGGDFSTAGLKDSPYIARWIP
jgi:hypothetical protein